jgi:hypothetical protein
MLCICNPETASPPPAMIAVRILGRRTIFIIMKFSSVQAGNIPLSRSNAASVTSRKHHIRIGNMLFLEFI